MWCFFQNGNNVVTSLIFNFSVRSAIQPALQVGPEVTCEGAKGTMRKLAFHPKHEKMNIGVLTCLALSIYLLKFPRFILVHFATFYYKVLVLAFLNLFYSFK